MGYESRSNQQVAEKRIAIIGTAQSWRQTPWDDKDLELWSLNDAYRMDGFKRAEVWFDFHPLNKFFYTASGKPIYAHQVPPGMYCRPEGHHDWLGKFQGTTYLHPGYKEQYPPAADWPNAKPFPKAEIEAEFGRYFTSSPAWMLALAAMQGIRDITITGIHLATEGEYIDQRPGFEFLLGRILGPQRLRMTPANGFRIYETEDGRVVLPESSPILSSNFQYAFDPQPRRALDSLKWDVHRFGIKRERAVAHLRDAKWWQRRRLLKETLEEAEIRFANARERLQVTQQALAA